MLLQAKTRFWCFMHCFLTGKEDGQQLKKKKQAIWQKLIQVCIKTHNQFFGLKDLRELSSGIAKVMLWFQIWPATLPLWKDIWNGGCEKQKTPHEVKKAIRIGAVIALKSRSCGAPAAANGKQFVMSLLVIHGVEHEYMHEANNSQPAARNRSFELKTPTVMREWGTRRCCIAAQLGVRCSLCEPALSVRHVIWSVYIRRGKRSACRRQIFVTFFPSTCYGTGCRDLKPRFDASWFLLCLRCRPGREIRKSTSSPYLDSNVNSNMTL